MRRQEVVEVFVWAVDGASHHVTVRSIGYHDGRREALALARNEYKVLHVAMGSIAILARFDLVLPKRELTEIC